MPDDAYYFGCAEIRSGHYLYGRYGNHVYEPNLPKDFPVICNRLDGGFLPPNQPQTEGHATLIHIMNWTILTFWDRSGDKRGNSNSAFIFRGRLSFDEVCRKAEKTFPKIWKRFTFPLIEMKE